MLPQRNRCIPSLPRRKHKEKEAFLRFRPMKMRRQYRRPQQQRPLSVPVRHRHHHLHSLPTGLPDNHLLQRRGYQKAFDEYRHRFDWQFCPSRETNSPGKTWKMICTYYWMERWRACRLSSGYLKKCNRYTKRPHNPLLPLRYEAWLTFVPQTLMT